MNVKFSLLIALSIVFTLLGCSVNNSTRVQNISLNGIWEIAETSKADSAPNEFTSKINVPSLIDQAAPAFKKLNYKHDTARYFWYRRNFSINHNNADVVELEIKKVKYGAQIYINGRPVAQHNIAFSASHIDIKNFLNKEGQQNEIIIRVGTKENFPDTVIRGDDFEKKTFFPGIFDDVTLLLKKAPFINNVQLAPDINKHLVRTQVEIKQSAKAKSVNLHYVIKEHLSKKIVAEGSQIIAPEASSKLIIADFNIALTDYTLWSPENPFLYELELATDSDMSTTRFGMRTFSIDTITNKFLLNNEPYYLLGTNVAIYRFFEDSLRGELPWNKEWVRSLFAKYKEMNWNSLRFHVGPAPDFWYDLADEMGILIQDEYSIWYGKGGFKENYKNLTTSQLVNEYTNWMRERWNHPSIVIWDAQNETVCNITGEALEQVRGLDLSNRPWDNGYSAPMRRSDVIEAHPYLFHDFHFNNSKMPEEGIYKFLFGKVRLPYNDPNEQDPSPDGKYYENAVILNEYGWLWLNRDGSPTTLSTNVYKNIFPEADTPEARLELYSKLSAALTEYWRAHEKVAGIQHFAGLTYSRPNEPKGQTCDCFKNIVNLEIHESFIKYVKPAFSPVALMLDVWDNKYAANEKITAPINIINDLGTDWTGEITLAIYEDEELIHQVRKDVNAPKYDVSLDSIIFITPNKTGKYQLRASLVLNGENVISYRDMNVK